MRLLPRASMRPHPLTVSFFERLALFLSLHYHLLDSHHLWSNHPPSPVSVSAVRAVRL